MTELKTLKDLYNHPEFCEGGVRKCQICGYDIYHGEDLRNEAIKWVKYLRQQISDKLIEGLSDWREGKINAFMQFFNLNEEDLK